MKVRDETVEVSVPFTAMALTVAVSLRVMAEVYWVLSAVGVLPSVV